jgi:hypothetical protein
MEKVFVVLVKSNDSIGIPIITRDLEKAIETTRHLEDLGFVFNPGDWVSVCFFALNRVYHSEEFSLTLEPATPFGEKPVIIFTNYYTGVPVARWCGQWHDDELRLLAEGSDFFQ